jgi:branched-chain amino acid transport system ATP-binding protein
VSIVGRVEALVAGHGGVPAVHGVDIEVRQGEVVALVGPNGAGKSTILFTLAGVLPSIDGRVEVLGEAVDGHSPHVVARRGFALVPEDRGLFYQLSVADNLRLRCPRKAAADVDGVLDHFPALRPLLGRRAGLLSGGEQQMLALAGALVGSPRLLVIDEMSLGLSPLMVERLLPLVRTIAEERSTAVLLVEQHVGMALAAADRGYVLTGGRIAHHGTADELARDREILEASYLGGARAG